jgi:hypothetical protein
MPFTNAAVLTQNLCDTIWQDTQNVYPLAMCMRFSRREADSCTVPNIITGEPEYQGLTIKRGSKVTLLYPKNNETSLPDYRKLRRKQCEKIGHEMGHIRLHMFRYPQYNHATREKYPALEIEADRFSDSFVRQIGPAIEQP